MTSMHLVHLHQRWYQDDDDGETDEHLHHRRWRGEIQIECRTS